MTPDKTQSASFISLVSNVALSGIKILTGLIGNSYALIADGIESLADCVSSLIVWNGIRVASKEADFEHPYGHGKAESIATFLAGLGLWVSASLIAWQSTKHILHPHSSPDLFTIPVILFIIVTKEFLYRFTWNFGAKSGSSALKAEAAHRRSDSMTSMCVLVGLCVAVFSKGKYASADDIAALLVTMLIYRNGWLILKPAVDELMDKRIVDERYQTILETIQQTAGVKDVETLLIRQSGRSYHVDLHIEVDPRISVSEGHLIAHRVKENLQQLEEIEIAYVGTHVEPHNS